MPKHFMWKNVGCGETRLAHVLLTPRELEHLSKQKSNNNIVRTACVCVVIAKRDTLWEDGNLASC